MKWYKSIIGLVLFCTSWEGNAQMFSIQGNLKHVNLLGTKSSRKTP